LGLKLAMTNNRRGPGLAGDATMRWMILGLVLLAGSPAVGDDLRVGAAAVPITPPVGTPMAGYYDIRPSDGVHDELHAKAVVLERAGARVALVSLDLIATTRDMVEEARAEIGRTTGVKGEDVLIGATHAHTGPVLKSRSSRDDSLGAASSLAVKYNAELPGRIAEAVRKAEAALTPATASAAIGRESSIAFNRRYHMKDGSVGWNPGKGNPGILKPAGTIDPDVPFVYFESADRKPLATYVNYAVHLDNVGGRKISADVPGVLSRLLADFKGPDMVTIFAAGCCGDVNHLDVRWPEKQGGFENASRMGIILAAEVLRSWPRLEPVGSGPLKSRSEIVRLTPREFAPGDVDRARAIVARRSGPIPNRPTFLESVEAFRVLDVASREGKPYEVEVQAIAIGDGVAWVSLPGEIFVELGLSIKQDSPFRNTILVELTNGSIGYVPSRRAYAQGNYEVVSARCAEGSGERLVDAAGRLLKDLHRADPGPPKAAGP